MKVLSGDKKSGAFSRFFVIISVLVFILLVALWFGARTDYGRDFAESKLSKHFGMKVSVESMRIGFPYVLVMDNLRTPDFESAGTAGFSVAEVRLGLGLKIFNLRLKYWSLRLNQLIVRVQDDGDGNWTPGSIGRLGDLRDADIVDIVSFTESVRNKIRLRVVNSNLGWLDVDGVEVAVARDVDFRMLPVRIDDRKMHYYVLDIRNASGLAVQDGRDMHWEWLTTPKTDYIELPGRSDVEHDEEWDEEESDQEDEMNEDGDNVE